PDQGLLVQWRPALQTDAAEAGALPAADATGTLPTRAAFPWQERPLPWAGTRSLWWAVGGGGFLALLLVLVVLRRYRSALALLVLVLLVSGGVSWWMLRSDAGAMDPEEFYLHDNWYGVAPITATVFAPFVAVYVVWRGIVALTNRSRRPPAV